MSTPENRFLDIGLILSFPDSDPHWAGWNLVVYVLCTEVNILCKHVQVCVCVCVCVCSGIFVDMAMGTYNTKFGVTTNYREIEGVIGQLYLLGFIILIKICMKTGSWTRDGFENLVMRGEGVRHPTTSVCRWLPPSMCSCECLIKQKCRIISRHKFPDAVGSTSIGNARIRRSRFCYPLFSFWISCIF